MHKQTQQEQAIFSIPDDIVVCSYCGEKNTCSMMLGTEICKMEKQEGLSREEREEDHRLEEQWGAVTSH